MNGRQIGWVAALLFVAFVVVSLVGGLGAQRQGVRSRIAMAGLDLIKHTNSEYVVELPENLRDTLAEMLSSTTRVASVSLDYSIGFSRPVRSTGRLTLTNAAGSALEIGLEQIQETPGIRFRVVDYTPR